MYKFTLLAACLFLLVDSLVGRPAQAKHTLILDRLEASVNSSIILLSDLRHFRRTVHLRAQLDPLFAGTPVALHGPKSTDPEIVQFLINERVINQQFQVTDAEVEQEINSIQTNNHLDRAQLTKSLLREGFEFSDYYELIRNSISKRNLIDREIRTKVSIPEEEVLKRLPASKGYHLQMITVSKKNYKTAQAAQKIANQALKDIHEGEAFEEVARRSSDHETAKSGGDLPVLSEHQMSAIFKTQIKKLKPTEVSKVFDADGRYYVLKLVDVKDGQGEAADAKSKDEVRNKLVAAEYEHQISLWLDRQRQKAFVHRAGDQSVKEIPLQP